MPYVEGKWIGPLENFYQSSYWADSMDGHLNRLRAAALEEELGGLAEVLKLEFPNTVEPIRSINDLLGYLRKKYAVKCGLEDDASFDDIRTRLSKKSKKKSNRR